ncbi:hypothetical protein BRADI_2g54222v3 [Brachypodium distachyon]|uniref:Uncharacterized protein n=1 Tax=Brachypodium distachyon TaxID=15368 RepID=A0A0Q3JDK1_BRADI|nr:hypothetical protein BRADI_2g54222v3 [Brachypodium distachyon]
MAPSSYPAPAISKTPSGNPLPRRGQVKESMGKQIAAVAVSTASVVLHACSDKKAAGAKKK